MATKFFKAKEIKLGGLHDCKGWSAVVKLDGKRFVVYTRANGKVFKAVSDEMETVEVSDLEVYQSDLFSLMLSEEYGIYSFATYQKRDENGIAEYISYDCFPVSETEYFDFLKGVK